MFVMEHGEFAAVTNALPSVDSFFLIGKVPSPKIVCCCLSYQSSGATLLSYLTLKELDKNNGGSLKFWIMFVVHRYIRSNKRELLLRSIHIVVMVRLTGLYAIVIGLTSTLVKFFATGIQV